MIMFAVDRYLSSIDDMFSCPNCVSPMTFCAPATLARHPLASLER